MLFLCINHTSLYRSFGALFSCFPICSRFWLLPVVWLWIYCRWSLSNFACLSATLSGFTLRNSNAVLAVWLCGKWCSQLDSRSALLFSLITSRRPAVLVCVYVCVFPNSQTVGQRKNKCSLIYWNPSSLSGTDYAAEITQTAEFRVLSDRWVHKFCITADMKKKTASRKEFSTNLLLSVHQCLSVLK